MKAPVIFFSHNFKLETIDILDIAAFNYFICQPMKPKMSIENIFLLEIWFVVHIQFQKYCPSISRKLFNHLNKTLTFHNELRFLRTKFEKSFLCCYLSYALTDAK